MGAIITAWLRVRPLVISPNASSRHPSLARFGAIPMPTLQLLRQNPLLAPKSSLSVPQLLALIPRPPPPQAVPLQAQLPTLLFLSYLILCPSLPLEWLSFCWPGQQQDICLEPRQISLSRQGPKLVLLHRYVSPLGISGCFGCLGIQDSAIRSFQLAEDDCDAQITVNLLRLSCRCEIRTRVRLASSFLQSLFVAKACIIFIRGYWTELDA